MELLLSGKNDKFISSIQECMKRLRGKYFHPKECNRDSSWEVIGN